jgi:hypothetical protein
LLPTIEEASQISEICSVGMSQRLIQLTVDHEESRYDVSSCIPANYGTLKILSDNYVGVNHTINRTDLHFPTWPGLYVNALLALKVFQYIYMPEAPASMSNLYYILQSIA